MYTLTPEASVVASQAATALALVIALIVIIFALAGIILFKSLLHSSAERYTYLVPLLFLVLGLPVMVVLVQTRTALTSRAVAPAKVLTLQTTVISPKKVELNLVTDRPVYLYLESENMPILPINGLQAKTQHQFTVAAGWELKIVINGEKYLLNSQIWIPVP